MAAPISDILYWRSSEGACTARSLDAPRRVWAWRRWRVVPSSTWPCWATAVLWWCHSGQCWSCYCWGKTKRVEIVFLRQPVNPGLELPLQEGRQGHFHFVKRHFHLNSLLKGHQGQEQQRLIHKQYRFAWPSRSSKIIVRFVSIVWSFAWCG